ncbi:MAG: hypothetical protein U9R42_08965 [Bacteroidota bacterium]|nr:hypothetical protein [Bacteroidota bacterium]
MNFNEDLRKKQNSLPYELLKNETEELVKLFSNYRKKMKTPHFLFYCHEYTNKNRR